MVVAAVAAVGAVVAAVAKVVAAVALVVTVTVPLVCCVIVNSSNVFASAPSEYV